MKRVADALVEALLEADDAESVDPEMLDRMWSGFQKNKAAQDNELARRQKRLDDMEARVRAKFAALQRQYPFVTIDQWYEDQDNSNGLTQRCALKAFVYPLRQTGGPADGTWFPAEVAAKIFKRYGIHYDAALGRNDLYGASRDERIQKVADLLTSDPDTLPSWKPGEEWSDKYHADEGDYSAMLAAKPATSGFDFVLVAEETDYDWAVATHTPVDDADVVRVAAALDGLRKNLRREFSVIGRKLGFTDETVHPYS